MDILSRYCGFNSLDQFLKLKNKKYIIDTNNHYADSILNYLVSIFRETLVRESEDRAFSCVVKETIIFIGRHPELIDKFQRSVSKTKNGQDFFHALHYNSQSILR